MSAFVGGSRVSAGAVRAHVVLAFTVVVAALGVFPYHLLALLPLAAAVTLSGIHRRVRLVVVSGSLLVLAVGVMQMFGFA